METLDPATPGTSPPPPRPPEAVKNRQGQQYWTLISALSRKILVCLVETK